MSQIKIESLTKSYDNNAPVISKMDLNIEKGSFTVLLGASGCGKSTLLKSLAGLEDVDSGKIYFDDEDVTEMHPGDRGIAMVFQNYALYPSMSVKENIEFGLKNMKVPTNERKKRIQEVANIVGLTEFLDRKPQNLSGGQRQRVALARAIVKEPKIFLMDEPLSNLDAKLRTQIRTDLIELYRKLKTTFVYVTHDQVEAMSMGTTIILLKHGEIQQMGSPVEIYEKPANVYVAKFIGSPPMNILKKHYIYKDNAEFKHVAFVGFRPEKVKLSGNANDARVAAFEGEILARELLGDQVQYRVNIGEEVVNIKTFNESPLEYGKIKFYVDKSDLHFFDVTENRIELDWEDTYVAS